MSCLPKPVLRGHIKRRGIRALIGAFALAAVNGALYHWLVAIPRSNAYDEFLQDYDAKAHYTDLVKWGYIKAPEGKEED